MRSITAVPLFLPWIAVIAVPKRFPESWLVPLHEPDPTNLNRFGGSAAAPVFQAVVPTIMHQLGIQPPNTSGGCPAK